MAFPTVAARNTSSESGTGTTSHTVNLPTGISAGDLLIVRFGYANTGNTVGWPAGWTAITNGAAENTTGSTEGLATAYRKADGSEGSTITVTTTTGCRSNHNSLRITGAADPGTQAPEAANNTTNNGPPDPPSLTPTGGAKDYLWIACGSSSRNGSVEDYTAAPTNYSNLQQVNPTGTGALATTGGTAERQLNAASEDPGAFVNTSTVCESVGVTIAVHPTGAAAAFVADPIKVEMIPSIQRGSTW